MLCNADSVYLHRRFAPVHDQTRQASPPLLSAQKSLPELYVSNALHSTVIILLLSLKVHAVHGSR